MGIYYVFMFVVLLVFSTASMGENITAAPDDFTAVPHQFVTPVNGTTVSDKAKLALRYGFHQTQECNSFEKSFVCIRKCLDMDFDVAHADKECICTCFKNKDKAKYKIPNVGPTRWRLGAPTTKLPPWSSHAGAKLVAAVSDFSSEMKPDGESEEAKHISSGDASLISNHTETNSTMSSNESGVTKKDSNISSSKSSGGTNQNVGN